jgi:hypothetical protein
VSVVLPARPTYRSGEWRLAGGAARFVSPLTGVGQSVARPGAYWRGRMELPSSMSPAQAQEWAAVLARLAGNLEAAFVRPPLRTPIASPGLPVVGAGAQTGQALLTSGWAANRIIPAGTFFSFLVSGAPYLHIVSAPAQANGSGVATLAIRPGLRVSPAISTSIEVASPNCLMELVDPDVVIARMDDVGIYGATLEWRERVTG